MNHIASPDNSDRGIEAQIQASGKSAPRITPADIEANIVHTEILKHTTNGGQILRWAIITTKSGFAVVGRPSSSVSYENDIPKVGEQVALSNSKQEMWPLMGYELKERLYQDALVIGAIPLQALPDTEDFPLGKACDRFDPTCESCQ